MEKQLFFGKMHLKILFLYKNKGQIQGKMYK